MGRALLCLNERSSCKRRFAPHRQALPHALLIVVLALTALPPVRTLGAVGAAWGGREMLTVDGTDVLFTNVSSAAHSRNWNSFYVPWTPQCSDTNACAVLPGWVPSYASGELYGSAHYGNLHGFVRATAWNTGPAAGDPGPGPTVTTVVSHGDVTASYRDELWIRSASLPAGSPVQIRFQVGLDVYYSSDRYGGGVGEGNYAQTEFDVFAADGTTLVESRFFDAPYVSGVYTNRQSDVIVRNASVGDMVPILQNLAVRSWVSASNVGAYASRKVDALNSATLVVEVLTPEAYFESTSGSKYAAVVPGQVALAIRSVAAGLVELAWPAEPQLPLLALPELGPDPVAALGTPTTEIRNGTNFNVLTLTPTNLQSFFYLGAPGG